MKKVKLIFFMFAAMMLLSNMNVSKIKVISENDYPVYTGNDLGMTYSTTKTFFRLWAPTASEVRIKLYSEGKDSEPTKVESFKKDIQGTWTFTLLGDWKNKFYTYQVKIGDKWNDETVDMYAKAVGVNGLRAMIIDLKETNPPGWEKDKRPTLKSYGDIIIWEAHVRDFSIHPNSGMKNKGKFLAFTEKGTKCPKGEKTGIDHLVDLGITHVHLLPAFDYLYLRVDETDPTTDKYNWGYDPQNFNVPEGSYSTNPYDGKVRINEFKQMVKSMHDNGIRVIMDVVYNHTADALKSNFHLLVPTYYYRYNADGSLSNASGCGNETASERPMMRKFMVESLLFWAKEYHVDGFRFDLMAIHDIETMNLIRSELDKVDKSIFLYGEGWTAGDSPLPSNLRASKENTSKLNRIAVFSDEIRDGIRGSWSDAKDPGFMCGKLGLEESIKFGIVGGTVHPQIKYDKVNYTKKSYVNVPTQLIDYVSCHDNPCLWDKINATCASISFAEKEKIQKLANAIVLTSQGVSFLHAGEEMMRTKHGIDNSYESPDSINWINWDRKSIYKEVYTYYQSLISLRKNHPAFHMPTKEMIAKNLKFFDMPAPLMVGYQIMNNANGDKWKNIVVFFNGNAEQQEVTIPEGEWKIVANGEVIHEKGLSQAGFANIQKGKTFVPGRSMLILVDKGSVK